MNDEPVVSVTDTAPTDQTSRRSPRCRRGLPTHPFESNGWSGRAAPRSPGQPPTEAGQPPEDADKQIPFRIPRAELEAQALACTHLVRACRQAIDDLNLEGSGDSAVNKRATAILRDVQTEWSTALRALRKISRR